MPFALIFCIYFARDDVKRRMVIAFFLKEVVFVFPEGIVGKNSRKVIHLVNED